MLFYSCVRLYYAETMIGELEVYGETVQYKQSLTAKAFGRDHRWSGTMDRLDLFSFACLNFERSNRIVQIDQHPR